MTEALTASLRAFLDAGQDVRVFWNLSLGEINEVLSSAVRQRKQEADRLEADVKLRAIMHHNLAIQIAEGVSIVLGTGKEITPLAKLYPAFFRPREMSLENYSIMFADYAQRTNERRAINGQRQHDGETVAGRSISG